MLLVYLNSQSNLPVASSQSMQRRHKLHIAAIVVGFALVALSGRVWANEIAQSVSATRSELRAPDVDHFIHADDGAKNASFAAFRTALLSAVRKHDKAFVLKVLAADVGAALGSGQRLKDFEECWGNLSPTSPFWKRLQRVLVHGAEFEKGENQYNAPSLTFEYKTDPVEPFAIVWNKDTALHEAPNNSSRLVEKIYGQQVTILDPPQPRPIDALWVKIKTKRGNIGYVPADGIFSNYDEFASFKKLAGKWRLTWFGSAGP